MEDGHCLGELHLEGWCPVMRPSQHHLCTFPAQDVSLRVGDVVIDPETKMSPGRIVELRRQPARVRRRSRASACPRRRECPTRCDESLGAGLRYAAVLHEATGRPRSRRRARSARWSPHSWTAASSRPTAPSGRSRRKTCGAPYRAQVALLPSLLPARVAVGSADRFHGREAPVVIYSLTSSTGEDLPRASSSSTASTSRSVARRRSRSSSAIQRSARHGA